MQNAGGGDLRHAKARGSVCACVHRMLAVGLAPVSAEDSRAFGPDGVAGVVLCDGEHGARNGVCVAGVDGVAEGADVGPLELGAKLLLGDRSSAFVQADGLGLRCARTRMMGTTSSGTR